MAKTKRIFVIGHMGAGKFIFTDEQCRKLLSSEFVVYLKVSIPEQLGRMKDGRVPSLPVSDMKDFLEKQHCERDAFYEEIATLIVESSRDQDEEINETVNRDANKVIKALSPSRNRLNIQGN